MNLPKNSSIHRHYRYHPYLQLMVVINAIVCLTTQIYKLCSDNSMWHSKLWRSHLFLSRQHKSKGILNIGEELEKETLNVVGWREVPVNKNVVLKLEISTECNYLKLKSWTSWQVCFPWHKGYTNCHHFQLMAVIKNQYLEL